MNNLNWLSYYHYEKIKSNQVIFKLILNTDFIFPIKIIIINSIYWSKIFKLKVVSWCNNL